MAGAIVPLIAGNKIQGSPRRRAKYQVGKQRKISMILLILLLLVLGGGGGYYGHSRWGYGGGAGIGLGTILLILLVFYMVGGLHI